MKGNELQELSRGVGINCLLEDKGGNIWAGLSSGGLAQYNTQTQQLIRYTEKRGCPTGISLACWKMMTGIFG
ncbi:hypothetical protein [Paraflavitalea speifideaquila]|uniref:hypothetical protein n=1 Tax=Paraflavitalea speifideaquila TaxID=3076558 RepID=UPI0028E5411B|nr:hypothetical protein [Paraflavitalea speifideiaquila]